MNFSLDHIGILVPDLARARGLFERLGFQLTRLAEHQAQGPDGRMKSAGSAQHSIMFGEGYIELQALDAEGRRSHLLAAAARRYHGIHIVALGADDARAAHRAIEANGVAVTPVMDWSRPINEAGAQGEARFSFFTAAYGAEDEAFLCWVQHLTPELVRPPGIALHANGALALTGFAIAAEGGAADLAQRYESFGCAPGAVTILNRAELPEPIAAAPWPARAWIAAMQIRFRDLSDFRRRCAAAGIEAVESGQGLLVDLTQEAGCWIITSQEN